MVILLLLPLLQQFLLLQITMLLQVLLLLQIFLLQVLLQVQSVLATLQLVKLLAGGRVPAVKPTFLTRLPSSVGILV